MKLIIEIQDEQYETFNKYYDIEGSIKYHIETIVDQLKEMEEFWKEKK